MVDPTLYLYTSLTAGSSHIITATSRLETILKANRIPFRAIDCATDEKARQLWGRRSKGRKIPGLVKYGQVIGDLEQVEEWNEFGELKMQVDSVSDIFGDTPMTDNPMEPPVNTVPPSALKPIVERSPSVSRSSSETRHISISEPKDRDKEPANAAAALKKDDTPLAMAMRQAGAEAAAKAGQKKDSTASTTKLPSIDVGSAETNSAPRRDSTDTTPSAKATRQSSDAAIDSQDSPVTTAVTDAKTPAQLTAEGSVRPGQLEKNAERSASNTSTESSGHLGQDLSNQEQVLDMRRRSSVVKSTSRLAEETSVADADEIEQTSNKAAPRLHRGSSVTEVPEDVARMVEEQNVIKEEPNEAEAHDHVGDETKREAKVGATDLAEKKVTKGQDPQDGKAGEADEAGVSVGD